MTKREDAVISYYMHKGLYNKYFVQEGQLMKLTKEMLDMLQAVWTRGKTDDKSGVADLIICYNGAYVAAELKDETNMPSERQLKFIEDVHKAGGKGAVCRTLADVLELLIS